MCCKVNKSDHYYGAFLSKVLDAGNNPAIVEKDNSRGIYKLSTNKDDYIVYIKYATLSNKSHKTWNFNYTDNNIQEIKSYINDKRYDKENIIFGYVCSYNDLINTEIALADLDELKECIDPNCTVNISNRVSIRKKDGSPYLRMYGTKKSDKKNGKDNTIKLSRSRINEL